MLDLLIRPAPTASRARQRKAVTGLLLLEAASFAAAAAVHAGLVVDGAAHRAAATAEVVIALVLIAALTCSRGARPWGLRCATAAQLFALVGVGVGLVAIATGAGPQTLADLAYHLAIVPLLIVGAAAAWSSASSGQEVERREP